MIPKRNKTAAPERQGTAPHPFRNFPRMLKCVIPAFPPINPSSSIVGTSRTIL
jgi:hypothetical protein